ncbi:rhodanese-like domain-containing protein [Desulfosediminicola ganghwensis]|uniref:rhodanese-like domain-containing protein n=1 Tax=Desulfosediminicola ganghwensis TaxID=2569540 RepID=UPI0010AB94A7|nr:rhodanese-like domain-containing protein [Desulfosediminicola ganghwensis]
MPAWKKAKNPLVASTKYLDVMAKFKNSVVVVDTREQSAVEKGHIEGAVAITADKLASMKDAFPAKKDAPIVIVAPDYQAGLASFDIIRGWGYKNTSVLKGGIAAAEKAGLAIAKGATATEIAYVPKPIPGAMSAAKFNELLAQNAADTMIIDVRTEDEAESGMITGAINIPTDEISDNLADIPKGKKIVTYCSTGIRAEMAYLTLKDNGYKVNFLKADTAFNDDGTFKITEN